MTGRAIRLGCGDLMRIWEDCWDGENGPLANQFPELFSICLTSDITIKVFREADSVMRFRRQLNPILASQWQAPRSKLDALPLSDDSDSVAWSFEKSGRYTVKSLYFWLERNLNGAHNKWIWKAKIPLKIQIFQWLLLQGSVITKNCMQKKNWQGSPLCSFCGQNETALHLFFTCSISRVVWGIVGSLFGTFMIPNSLWQFFVWMHVFLPGGDCFFVVGLAAVTWATWNYQNRVTFEKYKLR